MRKFKIRFNEAEGVFYEADFFAVSEDVAEHRKFVPWGSLKIGPLKECSFEVGREYFTDRVTVFISTSTSFTEL